MKDIIKNYWVDILIVLIISNTIAYGLSDFLAYAKSLALCTPLVFGLMFYFLKTFKPSQTAELTAILDETVREQVAILDEYEQIFDSMLVKLPCVCGGNTFEGLFSPNTENIVECDKCKNKYRVNINYDTVLLSNPLDLNKTFEDLVGGHLD